MQAMLDAVVEQSRRDAEELARLRSTLQRRSASLKKRWTDPIYREKQEITLKKHRADPVVQEKLKKHWADPTFREKQGLALKKRWADPTFREEQSAKISAGRMKKTTLEQRSNIGYKGGKLSGAARMEKLTPEKRSEIARNAVKARWAKSK